MADELERWIEIGDVDGFNLSHFSRNETFEDVSHLGICSSRCSWYLFCRLSTSSSQSSSVAASFGTITPRCPSPRARRRRLALLLARGSSESDRSTSRRKRTATGSSGFERAGHGILSRRKGCLGTKVQYCATFSAQQHPQSPKFGTLVRLKRLPISRLPRDGSTLHDPLGMRPAGGAAPVGTVGSSHVWLGANTSMPEHARILMGSHAVNGATGFSRAQTTLSMMPCSSALEGVR